MAKTLSDVMSTNVVTCRADTTLNDAARLMRDRDIGDVLVTEGDRLRGIVTDRDIVVRCLASDADPAQAKVSEACSSELTTARPDTSIADAARMMSERAIRRLPIVDDGRPVGIVSIGDLAVARDRKSTLADISAAAPSD
jgi:CBS domain-containing protein